MWAVLILVALAAVAILEIVLTETENFGWATAALLVSVVLVQVFHVANILGFVSAHLLASALYALVYVALGIVWSFVKWFSFLVQYRDKYRELKAEFLSANHLDTNGSVPEDHLARFKDFLSRRTANREAYRDMSWLNKPKASKNKGRIISWMSFWPFSMVGTVLNDPVRRLFNWLFARCKAAYQHMSDAVFAKDLELK